jgi:hypothetical protein
MALIHWLRRSSIRRAAITRRPRNGLPRLDVLEDRTLPSTFAVLNLNDGGPGSLRAELAAANANPGPDTINFAGGLHGTITLTSGELLITDSVTIKGPGANHLSVSGNNTSRDFDMTTGQNVSISGLTITQGFALDQGGGILNQGSNLTLSEDVLSRNVVFGSATTGGRGGALRSLGGALTITDCSIAGNQALGGTAPFGDALGGGIYVLAGTAAISDSTISGNLAQATDNSSDGFAAAGGLEVVSSATVTGCTFSGNRAVGATGGTAVDIGVAEGGAINDSGSLTIADSTFDHNQAIGGSDGNSGTGNATPFVDYAFGGAVSASFLTSVTVTNSSFSHNQAIGGNNSTATGTDILGVGGAEGGAFYNEVGAVATLTGCTFDHNQAIGGNGNSGNGPVVLVGEGLGGAIISGYGSNTPGFFGPNTLDVNNCVLSHNDAQGGDNNSGTASVSGLVGAGAGAGIANYAGGTATVSGSELDHNSARGGNHNSASGPAVFAGLGAGGAIFNYLGNFNSPDYGVFNTSVVTVSGSTIDHNQAQGGGGGNGEGGGVASLLSAMTTVAGSSVTQNQATGGGGGAGFGGGFYNDASSSLALTSSSVTQNHADGSVGIGGGVYTLGTFSYDASTVIADNHASTADDNIGP